MNDIRKKAIKFEAEMYGVATNPFVNGFVNGYQQGAREFAEWIHKYLGYSNDVLFTYRQSPVGFVIASKKSVDEIYAEWQKEGRE